MAVNKDLLEQYVNGDITLDDYIKKGKQEFNKETKETSSESLISKESIERLRIKWAADLLREL